MIDTLHRFLRVPTQVSGIQNEFVMDDVFQFCCTNISWIGWIIRVLRWECMNDTYFSWIAVILIKLDGSCMCEHHIMMGLE